jgi:Cu+-exporting ATPase
MSIMTATGRGAQAGVLIKDAEALERFAKVDTLIVDKTGTLTEGRPKLTDVVTAGSFDEKRLLGLAASLEKGSEHPLAEAIVEGASERGAKIENAADFEAVTGKGVQGKVGDASVSLGNRAMMEAMGLDTQALRQQAGIRFAQADGKTAMFVADRRQGWQASLPLPIRSRQRRPRRSVPCMKAGLKIIMATGDNQR